MPLIPTEKSESSTLFSLKELMTLEHTRVKEEEVADATRLRAAREAIRAAEQKERDDEQARLDRERDARELEERRKDGERARLEGVRQAELARAQADVEARRLEREHELRAAEAAAQREHEELLAAVRADAGYRRITVLACGMASLFAVVGITTGALWHSAAAAWQTERGDLHERLALALAKVDSRDATISVLVEDVDELNAKVTSLNKNVSELENTAAEPPKSWKPPKGPREVKPVVPEPVAPKKPCNRDPLGDCSGL